MTDATAPDGPVSLPAEHSRVAQLGYAVMLRILREDDFAYEDGEQLIDEMVELAGSSKQALGRMLTALATDFRRIDGSEAFLRMVIQRHVALADRLDEDGETQ